MKYFLDQDTGNVHAYEADGSQDAFIPALFRRMSTAEIAAHIESNTPSQVSSRRAELLNELAAIDGASARPLRAILVGSATEEDRTRLTELDEQAAALRAELATLEPPPAA